VRPATRPATAGTACDAKAISGTAWVSGSAASRGSAGTAPSVTPWTETSVPVPTKKPDVEAATAAPVYGDFVMVSGPNMKRAPAPESAGLPAPPPLFQCRSWDGNDYLGEQEKPAPRCAPLQVVALDGSASLGMASACEMRDDTCTAVAAEGLCDAWLRRLDEAEFKLRYASDDNRRERQAAFDAIDAEVKASRCSPVAPVVGPTAATPATQP